MIEMTEREQNSVCSEDTSSICEEEKVSKILQACDGDGYIYSHDLISVCHELNLEESLVGELIRELGVESDGRISYAEILRRQVSVRHDTDSSQNLQQRDYPTSSNNSLGVPSGGKNERWEFDSGARDLSPEPQVVQKLMEVAAVGTSSTSSTANLLQLANKLHLAALGSLRSEILDLSSRLQAVTEERDLFEKSLAQMQLEKESCVIQQYEDRIAKLQCVLEDLGCQVSSPHKSSLVRHLSEEDRVKEYSFDRTADDPQNMLVQEAQLLCNNFHDVACNTTDTLHRSNTQNKGKADTKRQENDNPVTESSKLNQSKMDRLKQNVVSLQTENAKLHAKLNSKNVEIKKLRTSINNSNNGKEKSYSKSKENIIPGASNNEKNTVTPSHQNPPVPKIAERVRLKLMEKQITGSDISCLGVSHTEVAEHLVSSVLEQCDLLEIGNDQRKFEIETERLISKLEHTRAFNTLLQSSLEEVKSYCERLTLLVGKYENNAIALQLAVNCCDQTIRAFEELVTTLRSSDYSENFKVEERHLVQLIDDLKKERTTIEGTVVQLESYVEAPVPQPQVPMMARRLDLETAVLIQEVMSMREEKADLNATIYRLEKDKEGLELKLATMETQQQTQLATVQHLKMLNDSLPECQDQCSKSQKEKLLRDQLREMAATLEHVSRNAEMRQKQHAEMMVELRTTNNNLLKNLEKNKHKYEARLHRLESQMLTMVSRHAAQVQTLKQRILQLIENKNDDQYCQQ